MDSVPIEGSPVRGNQVVPGIIKGDKINGKGFSVILSDGEFEEMENELKERSRISQPPKDSENKLVDVDPES